MKVAIIILLLIAAITLPDFLRTWREKRRQRREVREIMRYMRNCGKQLKAEVELERALQRGYRWMGHSEPIEPIRMDCPVCGGCGWVNVHNGRERVNCPKCGPTRKRKR